MSRFLVIALAVGVLVGAALFEGSRTNRWGDTEEIRAAAARLDGVPRGVGPWSSTENTIAPKILKVAEAVGHVARTYQHRETGARVEILMLCGPSGPIAAHTPDVCYAGNGFRMVGRQSRLTLALPGGDAASYWSARFEKERTDEALRVCWAWGVDGTWEASDAPWGTFALKPALYKLYATRTAAPTPDADRATNPDPVEGFLTVFLPEVKKALAPN
jgi:hypothetical protein